LVLLKRGAWWPVDEEERWRGATRVIWPDMGGYPHM
jgi:hypothetical protein